VLFFTKFFREHGKDYSKLQNLMEDKTLHQVKRQVINFKNHLEKNANPEHKDVLEIL
jgi:hypothetical protein